MKQICILLILSSILFACKKDTFNNSTTARINTSVDSVKFDTVFTTVGSITKSFKIFNNNEQKILLTKIKLSGGNNSAFKINVNGAATTEINNVEIPANDSIYVFVNVSVNPTTVNLPFIISDSILIECNGNNTKVNLQAYGQNANYIRNGIIIGNATFTNTLPYVILGSLQIASTGILTVNAGVKIYCHADAPILNEGTLICNGTKALPIIFNGDRLDEPYNNFPAAWPGIYCRATSKNNMLQFVQIKNAYQGLVVISPSLNANPKMVIKQSIIDNAFDAGLLCTNTSIVAENCLISNSGKAVEANFGGTYSFTHCTFTSYSNSYVLHKKPTLFITDANDNSQTNTINLLLRNCIIYGDAGFVNNEIETNKLGNNFLVNIDHCLYRANIDPANTTINLSIKNIDPSFDSINNTKRYYDFRITKNAAAIGINKGVSTTLIKDLDDNNRNVGIPDIGAYEKP